jgi:tetratricopeptide (TPR) repeat protein
MMENRISLIGFALLVATFAPLPGSGGMGLNPYESQMGAVVRGRIYTDGEIENSLTVELSANGRSISGFTASDGSFEFPSVMPGTYELRVVSSSATIVHHQYVTISGREQALSVYLPGRSASLNQSVAQPQGRGTVSVQELQHKIPSSAQREFSKGMAASKKGDKENALEHFQKAVSADPEFADGYNNLGAAEAALGRMEEAANQFQKAVDLVPDHSLALSNLSVTLCKMERYSEAEQAARRALRTNSGLLKIRYVLAVSLIAQHADRSEVLENLELSAPEVPKARLVAADILCQAGRRDEAAQQLERYLRSATEHESDRATVEAWLADLRR